MTVPLFRREALDHAGSPGHGAVLLVSAPATRYLTWCYALLAAGLLLLLVRGHYTRSVTISGVLRPEAGVQRVVSGAPGVVAAWHAAEGDRVSVGQPLLTLRGLRAGRDGQNGDEASGRWLQRQQQSWEEESRQMETLQAQRLRRAHERMRELELQSLQLRAQAAAQARRGELALEEWRRYRQLLAQGHVAAAQVQEREAGWLDQQQRSAELERSAAGLAAQLREAQAELTGLQAQGQRERAVVRRNLAAVRQQLEESEGRGEWLIRAASAGVVDALTVLPGQSVVAGQSLALLRPEDSPLVAELYAPTRAMGFLRRGQSVRLRYQAFPYQKFGQQPGTVLSVSAQALQPSELDANFAGIAGRTLEPHYRVRVGLARQSLLVGTTQLPLRAGSLVDASVRLETRPLYEWLLAPLASWQGRW